MYIVVHIKAVKEFVYPAHEMSCLCGFLSFGERESFRHRFTENLEVVQRQLLACEFRIKVVSVSISLPVLQDPLSSLKKN